MRVNAVNGIRVSDQLYGSAILCWGEEVANLFNRQVGSHSQCGRGGTPWNQHIVNSVRLVSYRGSCAWLIDVFNYTLLLFVSFVFIGTL